ncbi:MAG: S41 family peptidase [Alphaproteobacteria bacterium]|nr:MAG: S41 family peptidase [Alphaproteobacteria bacterium]
MLRYVKFLAAVALIAGLLSIPSFAANDDKKASKSASETYQLLNLFGDVFERTRQEYVEPVEEEKLMEDAINGMLSALDPHSSYLNAKNFQDMQVQTKGEFGGLGIEVTMEAGLIKVVSPIDDTPAAKAGLKPGDFVTHIDGEQVMGLTLSEAVEKLRGPVNTKVKLSVRRENAEPFDVTLTRDIIKIQSVKSKVLDDVGYVRITTFNELTYPGLSKGIEEIKSKLGDNLKGIVLDLRNNPGGLLDQAIAVSDAFLESGEIVSTRSRKVEDTQRVNAKPGDLIKGLPIVILINGGSASASEIVSGALQDNHRAIVLGTQSFGKGSVQTIIPLPGHGAMRLTTARYYTPSGKSIQGKGITPDIEVPVAKIEILEKDSKGRREADLRGALKNDQDKDAVKSDDKNGKKSDDKSANKDKEDADKYAAAESGKPDEDYQLARGVDLLRGIYMYNHPGAVKKAAKETPTPAKAK